MPTAANEGRLQSKSCEKIGAGDGIRTQDPNLARLETLFPNIARLFLDVRLFLWRLTPLEFELSFEEGFDEARGWLDQPATKEELERLCQESRAKHKHRAA